MMVVFSPVFQVLDFHRSRHLRTTALCVTCHTSHTDKSSSSSTPSTSTSQLPHLASPLRLALLAVAASVLSRPPARTILPAALLHVVQHPHCSYYAARALAPARHCARRPPPRPPLALARHVQAAHRCRSARAVDGGRSIKGPGATHNCVEVRGLTVGTSTGDVKVREPSPRVRAGADASACRRRSGALRRGCSRTARSRRSCA
jgi:hypothetical protein